MQVKFAFRNFLQLLKKGMSFLKTNFITHLWFFIIFIGNLLIFQSNKKYLGEKKLNHNGSKNIK